MADDKIEIEIELDDGSIRKGFTRVARGADDAGPPQRRLDSRRRAARDADRSALLF